VVPLLTDAFFVISAPRVTLFSRTGSRVLGFPTSLHTCCSIRFFSFPVRRGHPFFPRDPMGRVLSIFAAGADRFPPFSNILGSGSPTPLLTRRGIGSWSPLWPGVILFGLLRTAHPCFFPG